MTEIWKPVVGYEILYEVSDYGRVRRISNHKILKPDMPQGYAQVSLYKFGKSVRRKVYRLVLEAFVGPPNSNRTEANHIDGNKTNNNLSNLEWSTPRENSQHSWRCLGRQAAKGKDHYLYNKFGAQHHLSKTRIFISPVGEEFIVKGISEFCRKNGLIQHFMFDIANGKRDNYKGWKCRYP